MSTSAHIRATAAEIVAQVARGRSLDAALKAPPQYEAQQRALLKTLCYDTIRWYFRLDAILTRLLSEGTRLNDTVHALCLVGLCQLLHLRTPPHAAVAETVAAARLVRQPRAGGLINAVLRRLQRERDAIINAVDQDLALRTAHPTWLVRVLASDYPQDHLAILNANNSRPPLWLRVNRRRTTAQEYQARLQQQDIACSIHPFVPDAVLMHEAVDVEALPGFTDGDVSVQDAAAQLAAHLLGARAGDHVLDACAAPGGKTAHILELQPEIGTLIAIDESPSRLERVKETLGRLHLCAQILVADAGDTQDWWDGQLFDRILLDVPCSATGVIRRHPDIKLLRRPEDIQTLATRQRRLLHSLWSLLKPSGRLLYASCSALRAETSVVIADFLSTHADARDTTAGAMISLGLAPSSELGWQIAAGSDGMDGFYYACLTKSGQSEV